jgi:Methane oxygenase PmoA
MKRLLSLVILAAFPLAADVKIIQGDNQVSVKIDGKPFTDFIYGPDVMKPYLYPLRAPDGTSITRHVPFDKEAGDSTDHPHHTGLWFAHSSVNGYDFWNNYKGYTTPNRGSIVVRKIDKIESGKEQGFIDATMEWLDPDGKAIMTENRRMTFFSGTPNRQFDLDIKLTSITAVKFGDAKDGVLGIRLAAGLEEPQKKAPATPVRSGLMVNADGCKTEEECWGKRSNWLDYYGKTEGKEEGIAVLDNPANPRHPTYWHTRAYGLLGANIFGVHDFTKDKTADGSMTLDPGQSIRFRYRFIIHEGDTKSANIAAEWTKYASGQ